MSAPMVQAILAGKKTETRRIVNPQPDDDGLWDDTNMPRSLQSTLKGWNGTVADSGASKEWKCKYGEPGDVLWVREGFYAYGKWMQGSKNGKLSWRFIDKTSGNSMGYQYQTDTAAWMDNDYRELGWYKRNSIHMPFTACRLFLKIKSIRVEKLHDISEADATAEGIEFINTNRGSGWKSYTNEGQVTNYPVLSYMTLWESVNGIESREANPWVWVVKFERTEKPIL